MKIISCLLESLSQYNNIMYWERVIYDELPSNLHKNRYVDPLRN